MLSTEEELTRDGFSKEDGSQQHSTIFDYEALKDDDDKELWLVRVPERVPHSGLVSMHVNLSKTPGKPLSRLYVVNDDTYTLYCVPEGNTLADDVAVSGHELLGFSCLVPSRDKKGKLMFAPKKVALCLVLVLDGSPLTEDIYDTPVMNQQSPDSSNRPWTAVAIDSLVIPRKRTRNDECHINKKRKLTKDGDYSNDNGSLYD